MHERQALRDAIKEALAGATTAGSRIHVARTLTLRELPAVVVYVPFDEAVPENDSTEYLARRATVLLEGFVTVAGGDDSGERLENSMDDFARELEVVMDRLESDTTDERFEAIAYDSTETDTGDDGKRPIGAVKLTYLVEYLVPRHVEAAPGIFDTVHEKTSIGDGQEQHITNIHS